MDQLINYLQSKKSFISFFLISTVSFNMLPPVSMAEFPNAELAATEFAATELAAAEVAVAEFPADEFGAV